MSDFVSELIDRHGGLPEGELASTVVFEGDERERFRRMLFDELRFAEGSRTELDHNLELWRDWYNMVPGPVPYPDAPNITSPLVRKTINTFTAHMSDVLNKVPFFSCDPQTRAASSTKPVWDVALEREIRLTNGKRQIDLAILESGITGTGVVRLSSTLRNEEFVIPEKVVRLENFYASPSGLEDVYEASTFERFVEPLHVVMRKALKGVYDVEELNRLVLSGGSVEPLNAEKEDGVTSVPLGSDNQPVEIWYCYYRYGGKLYLCYVHQDSETLLSVQPSPHVEALGDKPPYTLIKPYPVVNYMYGDSIPLILGDMQGSMDWAINAYLGYMKGNITPSVLVSRDSSISQRGKRGMPTIYPGSRTEVEGNPQEVLQVIAPPPPQNAERFMEIISLLAADSTFNTNQLSGQPIQGVRTATEVGMMKSNADVLLNYALRNVADDLARLAEDKWSLFVEYKVMDAGILRLFNGEDQYLLAASEIPADEIEMAMLEFGVMSGMYPPEMMQLSPQELRQFLPPMQLMVAGALRDDLHWRPNGSELGVDKLMRAQKMERLMQFSPIIQAASEDKSFYNIVKAWLQSMEIHNWRDFVPAEPPNQEIPFEQRMMMMTQISEMMGKMRMGGGGKY